MPGLSIENYNRWASDNLNTTAALAKTDAGVQQLADIKTTTTGAQRAFNTAAFKGQVKDVRADFQRALTVRFGSSLAQEALESVGGKPLTGAAMKAAIAYAKSHTTSLRSQLAMPGSSAGRAPCRLTDSNLSVNDLSRTARNVPLDQRKLMDCLKKLQGASANVLGTFPTGAAELAEMEAQCDYLKSEFALLGQEFSKHVASGDEGAKGLAEACFKMCDELDSHFAKMKDANANGPLAETSVNRLKDVWHSAFREACQNLSKSPKVENNIQAKMALKALAAISKEEFAAKFKLDKDFGKMLGKDLAAAIKAGCGKGVFDAKACQKALTEANVNVLNRRAWDKINKQFTVALDNQNFQVKSEITPGKHVSGVGETYPEGVNGFMCHSAGEKEHAVNLAISKVSVEGKDGKMENVFTGVRHGVHSAWEIKNGTERRAANLRRAQETVKAAFSVYLENHPGLSNAGVIKLPMTSVSLMTPDVLRDVGAMFTKKQTNNETRMLIDQTEAWEAIQDQGEMEVTLKVDGQDKTFRVKPEIAKFSFGVNGLSFGAVNVVAQSWDISDMLNAGALKILNHRVQAFISDPNVPQNKADAAQTLLNQLKNILDTKAERQDNHDGYKAAVRVAVLTSLMDGVPCWNCKSGKDRTGEMDVECKFLSTLIARGKPIPEPGAKLTTEQKNLFRSIALQSGNLEMQEYNTGIAGFKTEKVDSIVERLGGVEGRKFHAGGSKFVKF